MTDRVGAAAFQIDVSGIRELAQDFGGAQAQRVVFDELVSAGQRSGKIVKAKAATFIRNQSGQLAKNALVHTSTTANQIDTIVTWVAKSSRGFPYAAAVNYGRGPVVAKRAKYLHFFIDGKEFFRKRVGPAKAQFFAERGLQAAESLIVAEHQRAADRAAAKLEAL